MDNYILIKIYYCKDCPEYQNRCIETSESGNTYKGYCNAMDGWELDEDDFGLIPNWCPKLKEGETTNA